MVLALVCSASPLVASPEAAEHYERGRAAFLSGDYRRAVELLEASVGGAPNHLGYRLLLARAYEFGGQSVEAEAALVEIVKRQPKHREAAVALARRYFKRQAYAAVVEVLQPLRPPANDYEAYHLLGTALYYKDRLEEARRMLARAIAADDSHADDHRLLGDIALAQERFALAIEAYEQAQSQGLDDARLHFKLATAYFRLRNHLGDIRRRTITGGQADTVQAEGYVIEAVPSERDTFYVSPPASAVFHAQKARDLGLDSPELRLLLGDIWLAVRRYDRALTEYQEVEARVPQSRRGAFYLNYARASLGAGDPEGYLVRLKQAAELDHAAYAPLLGQAYVNVAELHNQEGDTNKYLHYMRLAVKHAPESSDLHYRLGNALWEAGRRADAERHWRITLELRPDHPDRIRMLELIRTTRMEHVN